LLADLDSQQQEINRDSRIVLSDEQTLFLKEERNSEKGRCIFKKLDGNLKGRNNVKARVV
jgi:hypothetical protein